ncbi:MAG: TIR domain-containing protein [Clostridia bacterium]|nr:TIR domain-containing protein [Clostridia bacterium]
METTYKYDAFISYRHLSPDKPVAERLQKLLETYTPPKDVRAPGKAKKMHLFRDETELPTSNDLGGDIRGALERSRYLVVICSPEYEKSKWCMEEVAYFKKLHGGSNKNIITLLADDPDRRPSFPDALRFETETQTLETGETVTTQREIEPLAANVSAKTQAQMLKKLKTEFLRIAAPLIGCGFDDLYKREQRRRTRRILTVSLSTAAVFAVAALMSISALLTISSQKKQIEENAAALLSSNQELLIRESELLEKDGDLYGALESAAQAIPDDGTAPNGAIGQSVSLLGVFEPDSFAPFRKIRYSETSKSIRSEDILLLNGGKTLAVKHINDGLSLWNTETGERIEKYEADGAFSAAFYRNPRIGEATLSNVTKGSTLAKPADNFELYSMYHKDVQEETAVGDENAVFILNGNDRFVSRLSPTTGKPLWTAKLDDPGDSFVIQYPGFPFDYLSCADLLPVQTSDALLLLDGETGDEKIRYDLDSLTALFHPSFNVYPVDGYLIFIYSDECMVCRATPSQPEVLFRTELFASDAAHGLSVWSFGISGRVLCVSGIVSIDSMNYTAVFRGYDLKSGALLWSTEFQTTVLWEPVVGFIDPDKGAKNDYPVAFAVVGDRLFAANTQTGTIVLDQALPGETAQVYYSENGYVFITNENGLEYFAVLRHMTSEEKPQYLYLNREFQSKFNTMAYCNNIYAIIRSGEPDVILYRVLPNDARRTLYRRDDETQSGLSAVALSPDKSLAAIKQSSPEELVVLNTETGNVLQAFSFEESVNDIWFFGKEHLAVRCNNNLLILSLSFGKTEREFRREDYNIDAMLFSTERLIIQTKTGAIRTVEPGHDPVELTLPDSLTVSKMYSMSPSGKYLLQAYEKNNPNEPHLWIMDVESGAPVTCGAFAAQEQNVSKSSCLWVADESAVYLLWNDVVVGFSCADGSILFEAPALPSAEQLLWVDDSLCIIDNTGYLTQVQINGAELSALQKAKLFDGSPGRNWVCTRGRGSMAYLLQLGSDSCFFDCAVIDTESLEVVYRIDKCCGIDVDRGVVYRKYYDCFDAYPIPDTAQLKTLANARLGS